MRIKMASANKTNYCIGCQKVDDAYFIFNSIYWNILLSEDQHNLGRCIVSAKRHAPSLSEITSEELLDFHQVVKTLESSIKKAFGAEMFNWGCLMNDAYKNTPPNPHVHWHLRPRYNYPVKFSGITFNDTEFAHHYTRTEHLTVSSKVRKEIISEIKKYL